MATGLAIALHNVMQNGTASAAALVDVFPIEPRSGTRLRGVVVPCDPQRERVEVTPGRYLVQTILPSGEMIDREVEVAAGQTKDVVLIGEVTPHEWLGWQRFSPAREMLWDESRPVRSTVTATLVDTPAWLVAPLQPGAPLPPAASDARTSIFEIQGHPWGQRAVAVIRRDHRVDGTVLPVPWGRHDPKVVQIAVPHDADLPIAVAIQDPELGPLIGYLSGGAVTSARTFLRQDSPQWQQFIEMLAEKFENPFGAAIAGYVLLATARELDRPYWHPWIENLANKFPWIPDGAVLCGWLALQRRDRAGAKGWFHQAIARGVPAVTGVLRMLHDGLVALNDEADLGTVRAALARADVTQPFVTLRFDEETP